MIDLKDVINYLDCPRKYSLNKVNSVKVLSDNNRIKLLIKEAYSKLVSDRISYTEFEKIIGQEMIVHGKTKVLVKDIYDCIYKTLVNSPDTFKGKKLSVSLKSLTYGYEQSLYNNIYQVVEYNNQELNYAVLVLNVTPKIDVITLKPRTQSQVKEVNELIKSVERVITMVEQNGLVFIKRPNGITCSKCEFNSECKPICYYKEAVK